MSRSPHLRPDLQDALQNMGSHCLKEAHWHMLILHLIYDLTDIHMYPLLFSIIQVYDDGGLDGKELG